MIEASVWIASSTELVELCELLSLAGTTGRFSAEMMPVVTVLDSPSGAPTATTFWPIARLEESPRVAGVSPLTPLAWITARSLASSRPTIFAGVILPLPKVTVMLSPAVAAAATTWLLVRISPLEEMMIPLPSSPVPSAALTEIVTTDGRILAAAAVT